MGNEIIERKRNTIYVEDDKVIKVLTANIAQSSKIDYWLTVYDKLYAYDNRIVKIYDINDKTITMEKINYKYTLEYYMQEFDPSYSHIKLNSYISQYMDIWNNFFQFSFTYLNDFYFFHTDYKLANVLVDENDNLRLIDPDSFKVENLFGYIEPAMYVENLIRLAECRRFYKNDFYRDIDTGAWLPKN